MEGCRIGCVLMAAGRASRFGADKLLAEFDGRSLLQRALDAIPEALRGGTAAVTRPGSAGVLAEAAGLLRVENPHPELGVSHTIRLGIRALIGLEPEDGPAGTAADETGSGAAEDYNGILFLVADQPLLRQETVAALAEAFRAAPDRIVVPTAGGQQGNPCIFPRDLFPALLALTGDRGGKQVIRAHPDRVLPVEVPPEELWDVDSPEALTALRGAWEDGQIHASGRGKIG